jgi:hypothetical protein
MGQSGFVGELAVGPLRIKDTSWRFIAALLRVGAFEVSVRAGGWGGWFFI